MLPDSKRQEIAFLDRAPDRSRPIASTEIRTNGWIDQVIDEPNEPTAIVSLLIPSSFIVRWFAEYKGREVRITISIPEKG